MIKICKTAGEILSKENIEYRDLIPLMLEKFREYYPDYFEINSRVGFIEEDNKKIKEEIELLKREVKILKKDKFAPLPKSFIEIWDNEDDEIWNEFK